MIQKTLLPVFVCLLSMCACSSSESERVTIEGQIAHLGQSRVHVSYYINDHSLGYDTVFTNETGHFKFQVSGTAEINPITLFFPESKCWTTVFAKAGDDINLQGDLEMIDLLTIKGGKVNEDLTLFKQDIRPLYIERQRIVNNNTQKEDEGLEVRLAEINVLLKRKAKEFIMDHPGSYASVVLIQDFFYQDYDPNTAELLALLTDEAKNNALTERLKQGITEW